MLPCSWENSTIMFPVKSDRPLAVFDIEGTGTSPRADRIIELAVTRIHPDGSRDSHTWLLNPTIPIPPESTDIHGITDDIVRGCPTFAERAMDIFDFIDPCDLCGYNLTRYDVPMLCEEFLRAGISFDIQSRRIIDVQRIFHRHEPRDLSAALMFYCGREHVDAHGAEADVKATIDVLEGQYARYADLPHDIDALDRIYNERDPLNADRAGRFRWVDGELTVNFGKKKGAKVKDLAAEKGQSFLRWMIHSEFPIDTRKIAEDAMRGILPVPPPQAVPRARAPHTEQGE